MQWTKESLRYDEMARNLCKPLGCRVAGCMRNPKSISCSRELDELNTCIRIKRDQIVTAVKEGKPLSSITPFL